MIRSVEIERADRTMLVVAAVVALAIGVVAAAASPLIPLGAIATVLAIGLVWRRPIVGVYLFVAVVALLPFGVIPIPLAGTQLTFVDSIMIATFSAMLARWVFTSDRLPRDPTSIALIAFVLVAIAAFVGGSGIGSITPELVRRTGKLLASLLFFLIARDLLNTTDRLAGMTRALILAGAVQGAIGAGLMALSPLSQLTLLTRLEVIGYPSDNVLRYVPGPNATYTDQLRAIGTSVDPNVFAGTLMLALVLIVVQWASPRPVLRKSVLCLLALPTAGGVLLSLSRASWAGLAIGLGFIGVLRYRRILVLGVIGAVCLLATPVAQSFIVRFVGGFSTADPATAFRVGEYTNALTLLGRYPLLGIGFGESPDIDVTAGVSSVYLLVAEQTGLLGLGVYVFALGAAWVIGLRGLRQMRDLRLQGIRAAFLAALTAALVTGLLDQYFANQTFPHAVALFWLYAAVLVSASRLAGEPTCSEQPPPATDRG
ncbi:MAG: O-antigen ligase family protein [Chloroflexi bacterium]|nr:O-antigen ligase family protein [Chloroflexota bacterium]